MQGERLPDDGELLPVEPGQYQKRHTTVGVRWFFRPPVEGVGMGQISPDIHEVIEHEDGTISVTVPRQDGKGANSILVNGGREKSWHGYVERGIWRSA